MKENLIYLLFIVLSLTACSSPKNVLYIQDATPLKQEEISQNYEVRIQQDDLLSITVSSKDPELIAPFNMAAQTSGTTGAQKGMEYMVDLSGNIDFPLLGKINVNGLTRMQLTYLIQERLIKEDYVKDPIVTVKFQNFKVSVLGEVGSPGSFTIPSERITLLEVLSMAGDLSIYGNRNKVTVIRENNGKRTILYQDLTSSEIFNSPCYYLQQNDIVYVEPIKNKMRQRDINPSMTRLTVWITTISGLISIASLVINLSK